jgi:hypothetical protein
VLPRFHSTLSYDLDLTVAAFRNQSAVGTIALERTYVAILDAVLSG